MSYLFVRLKTFAGIRDTIRLNFAQNFIQHIYRFTCRYGRKRGSIALLLNYVRTLNVNIKHFTLHTWNMNNIFVGWLFFTGACKLKLKLLIWMLTWIRHFSTDEIIQTKIDNILLLYTNNGTANMHSFDICAKWIPLPTISHLSVSWREWRKEIKRFESEIWIAYKVI